MTKTCIGCEQELPLSNFQLHRPRTGRAFLDSRCRVCTARASLERIAARRAHVDAIKLERGCMDCGYSDHPAALDFDHRPGTGPKRASVAALVTSATLADIDAEIAKCDVVCANCHRIRTAERGWARPAGERRRQQRAPRGQMELAPKSG
jgi:hypothetical protein